MNFVWQQLIELLAIVGTGMLCACFYNCYLLLRRWLKPRVWLSNICDLLFWLCLTVLVFGLLLLINCGNVRLYVFVGLILGAIIYFKGAGKLLENSFLGRTKTAHPLSGRKTGR